MEFYYFIYLDTGECSTLCINVSPAHEESDCEMLKENQVGLTVSETQIETKPAEGQIHRPHKHWNTT